MKAFAIKFILVLYVLILRNEVKAQDNPGIIPDNIVVQHAGSIGYISLGAGYNLFKNDRGNLEFSYGLVPESKGGPLHIVTTKFAYRLIEIDPSDNIKIYPLNPGLFFSYHLDKQFDITFDQEQYGKSYYGWSTAIRGHLSISNEIKLTSKSSKSITLYSEFNASDLYLASIFFKNNREWLKPQDIVKLGIGVRVGF